MSNGTSTRFDWAGSSKESCAIELAKRGFARTLYKDSDLICLVCGRKPKENETVYYPARGTSENNKVIAHKDECDREYAKARSNGAKPDKQPSTYPTGQAGLASPKVSQSANKNLQPSAVADSTLAPELVDELERLKGWREGVMFALDRRVDSDGKGANHGPAWFQGWHEGVMYGLEHQRVS